MPKFLERKLKSEARKKGYRGRRAAEYTYGTLNRIGAMRGNRETRKGARMAAKHKRDKRRGRRA